MEMNPAGGGALSWGASAAPAFRILPGRAFCAAGNFLLHKKESCLQDSPPAAGRFSDIYLSTAVQSCPVGLFYAIWDSNGISYCIKKTGTAVSCDVSYFSSLRQYLFFTIVGGSLLKASGYCKFL